MPLPIEQTPSFILELPSNKKRKIRYRPFTVREEKILLMAVEEEDSENLYKTIMDVISSCVKEEDFDCKSLYMYDVAYIIMKIRSKSLGNIQSVTFIDEIDQKEYTVDINFDEVEVKFDPDHKYVIEIDEHLSVYMKDLTLSDIIQLNRLSEESTEYQTVLYTIIQCLDKLIEDEETVYDMKEFSEKEKLEWVHSLSMKTRKKLSDFVESMPRIEHEIEYEKEDGTKAVKVIDGNSTNFL